MAVAIVAACFGGLVLGGCSLPGRAFPGGPSPWLPGGAPGSVYATPAPTTVVAPAQETGGGAIQAGVEIHG